MGRASYCAWAMLYCVCGGSVLSRSAEEQPTGRYVVVWLQSLLSFCTTNVHGHPFSVCVRRRRSRRQFCARGLRIQVPPESVLASVFKYGLGDLQAQSAWHAMILKDGSSSVDKAMPNRMSRYLRILFC